MTAEKLHACSPFNVLRYATHLSVIHQSAVGRATGQLPSEYKQALLCFYAHARTAVRSDVI